MFVLVHLDGNTEVLLNTVAKVVTEYCKKGEGVLLDEFVMPLIEYDLQKIKRLRLVTTPAETSNKIECKWHPNVADGSDHEQASSGTLLPEPIFLQSSDLAFTGYTLGKEGIASHDCPYCKLIQAEWT